MKNKWLSGPYLFWMAIFIVVPLFITFYYALTKETATGLVFSLENFQNIFQKIEGEGISGFRQFPYLFVLCKSVLLAFICTIICFVLGYPIAFILASKEYVNIGFLLFLFVAPMWMNYLLRTYAWLTLLEKNGVINDILAIFGFRKRSLLYNDGAVMLGMVYNFLPFMILPIHTVLKKMDSAFIEAAQDLGANPRTVFTKVVFPLTVPGIISGITMVFMPAVTTFIIPSLLGGGQYTLIGNLIERQFLTLNDWNFGSALSVLLMFVILLSMAVFSIFDKDGEGGTIM